MFNNIRVFFHHMPRLLAVEVYRTENGDWLLHAAILKQKWTRVSLEKEVYGLQGLKSAGNELPRGLPVVICLQGKGVMHRRLPAGDKAGLNQLLPGARQEDFYVQEMPAGDGKLLSAVRKSTVDELLAALAKQGMRVLTLSLGPFALLSFGRLLPESPVTVLQTGRHRFTLNEQWELLDYSCLPDEPEPAGRIRVGDVVLNRRLLPAFALGCAVMGGLQPPSLEVASLAGEETEYRQRLYFRRLAGGWLLFLFGILLVNTCLFLHYSTQVAGLEYTDMHAVKVEADSLKKRLSRREEVLGRLAVVSADAIPAAVMADRLVAGMPGAVRLTELQVYPRDEAASRKTRRPVYGGDIRVTGSCAEATALNEWMERLRTLAFCAAVQLEEYIYAEKESRGQFTMILKLK